MFLFNDILVYGSIVIKNKKFARQHIIPLQNVKIENMEDDNGKLAVVPVLKIQHFPFPLSRYTFRFANKNTNQIIRSLCCLFERKEWMDQSY